MSQRQIAAAVGVHEATVSRDLNPVANASTAAPDHAQSEAPAAPHRATPEPSEPTPDLHDPAKAIPTTDKSFRATVNLVLSDLDYADVDSNQPITEEKIEEARRLFEGIDEFRQG
jgi:hypothetical protein